MDSSRDEDEEEDFARFKVFNLTQPVTNSIFERQVRNSREESQFTSEANFFNNFQYALNDNIPLPVKSPKHIQNLLNSKAKKIHYRTRTLGQDQLMQNSIGFGTDREKVLERQIFAQIAKKSKLYSKK